MIHEQRPVLLPLPLSLSRGPNTSSLTLSHAAYREWKSQNECVERRLLQWVAGFVAEKRILLQCGVAFWLVLPPHPKARRRL